MSEKTKLSPLLTTTIDLIRHGEPEGGRLFRGWRDDPLSEHGWHQMRAAIADHKPWDLIVSSPLARCASFAAELGQRTGISVEVDARLKEIGFGEWEGCSPESLFVESPEELTGFWENPVDNPPPGGEPMVLFQLRVERAWQDIQVRYAGKHLLIVAHGGVNRLIISKVLGIPLTHFFRIDLPYAGISRIRLDEGVPRLVFHCASLD